MVLTALQFQWLNTVQVHFLFTPLRESGGDRVLYSRVQGPKLLCILRISSIQAPGRKWRGMVCWPELWAWPLLIHRKAGKYGLAVS